MGLSGVKAVLSRARGVELRDIEDVYRSHGSAYERVAIAIIGDDGLGCEAVSEAFVRAIRSRHGYRGDAPVAAWLWRIVVNEARRRRARAVADLSDGNTAEVAGNGLNGHVDQALIRAKVAALPERQRLALFLRYYADLDYESIAVALGVRPGTIAATLSAAHRRLALDLQEVRTCKR